jgi:hypothetical protein
MERANRLVHEHSGPRRCFSPMVCDKKKRRRMRCWVIMLFSRRKFTQNSKKPQKDMHKFTAAENRMPLYQALTTDRRRAVMKSVIE